MIFLQLGFYSSVPLAGMLIYDHLKFDILLTSSAYSYQEQPYDFPAAALSVPFPPRGRRRLAPLPGGGGLG